MRPRLVAWALLATSVAIVPAGRSTVAADEAADARFFDRLARRAFARGRYHDALAHFLSSQRATPNARTLFNIAISAELAHEPRTALTHYVEYLSAAADDDPERRTRAERAVAELRDRVPVIEVTSEPSGATIYVDRRELGSRGRTPRLVPVEAGEHRVIVVLPDHHPAEVVVVAETGAAAEARLELEPVVGELRVNAHPEGARVVVTRGDEEVARGTAPLSTTLPIGRYRVAAEAEGHSPDRTSVRVERDGVAVVFLEPRPREAITGRLLISVTPDVRAEVTIDGRWAGVTPLTRPRVRAGAHRVEVRAAGHRPWRERVRVPARGAIHLAVELVPLPDREDRE